MRYVRVTIQHQPDAGQNSTSNFSYPEELGHTDIATARDFAFKGLGEGNWRKGFINVAFVHVPAYHFRFERVGLMGHELVQIEGRPENAQLA